MARVASPLQKSDKSLTWLLLLLITVATIALSFGVFVAGANISTTRAPKPLPGTRVATEVEMSAALGHFQVRESLSGVRIWYAERDFSITDDTPQTVIVPHGVKVPDRLRKTVVLLESIPQKTESPGMPPERIAYARVFFDPWCFGAMLEITTQESCDAPRRDNLPGTPMAEASRDFSPEYDAPRWGTPKDVGAGWRVITKDARIMPLLKEPANYVLDESCPEQRGCRLTGGSFGLNQVNTLRRLSDAKTQWSTLYDPYCTILAQEESADNEKYFWPLEDALSPAIFEEYRSCIGKTPQQQEPSAARNPGPETDFSFNSPG